MATRVRSSNKAFENLAAEGAARLTNRAAWQLEAVHPGCPNVDLHNLVSRVGELGGATQYGRSVASSSARSDGGGA
jgi:hypothetical protein